MHRRQLLSLLDMYRPAAPDDQAILQQFKTFVATHPNCFERTLTVGHVTGSAWIVSPDRNRILLVYHRKLNRWLQPGGHADGDSDIFAVARREAVEETGLQHLRPLSDEIFDLDIHLFPATSATPAHLHYDVRFLFKADPSTPLTLSHESIDLGWFALSAIVRMEVDRSVLRMVEKTRLLRAARP